jgi:D-alanyl-D-alanine carboxypeptidase/D-alanyl-D-alanine-endopeptidase (penicillin-binding protein 4)
VSLNADAPFQMASVTKLVTILAALDLLGPDYRWRTQPYLDGILYGGRLPGDLIIVGGGDASLSSDGLRAWFGQLRERGLREVWGDIVLDRFAFSLLDDELSNTPPPAHNLRGYARPDALMLDEGVLCVALQTAPKRPASVQVRPAQAGLLAHPLVGSQTASGLSMTTIAQELGLSISCVSRLIAKVEAAAPEGQR